MEGYGLQVRFALPIIFAAIGCSQVQPVTPTDSAALVGGEPVTAGRFSSVVAVVTSNEEGSCTAVKLRKDAILLAAHCLVGTLGGYYLGEIRAEYRAKAKLRLTHKNSYEDYTELPQATVAASIVHPGFSAKCNGENNKSPWHTEVHRGCDPFDIAYTKEPIPDVAIVQFEENLELDDYSDPSLPEVWDHFLQDNVKVTLTGYGREGGNEGEPGVRRLKYGTARTISVTEATRLADENGFDQSNPDYTFPAKETDLVPYPYLFTPGRAVEPTAPDINAGDSGGPVFYRTSERQEEWKIVGINSLNHTAFGENLSFLQSFVRLHDNGEGSVGRWIKETLASM